MKEVAITNLIVLLIGFLSTGVAVARIGEGASVSEQYYGLFIGITLIGSACINHALCKRAVIRKPLRSKQPIR